MRSLWRSCFLVALTASAASDRARLYDLVIQTGMPHLEENLRYAVTRTQRCLARGDLDSVFPVLDHPSLAGCKLSKQGDDGDSLSYVLVCERSPETTGTATWRLGERAIHGTLEVKAGGKNMTFFQRVTGTLMGECPRDYSVTNRDRSAPDDHRVAGLAAIGTCGRPR